MPAHIDYLVDVDRTEGSAHRMDMFVPTARRLLVALAAVVVVLLPGAPARAHNSLVDAQPGKGATLTRVPAEVRLRFLQRLHPGRTSITVSDAAGQTVSGAAETAGKVGTVALPAALPNGVYTVAYAVASTDGHPVEGSYRFTVAAPAASSSAAAASPAASPSPAASAPSLSAATPVAADGGLPAGVLAGLVAAGAVLAGLAGVWLLRRRRP